MANCELQIDNPDEIVEANSASVSYFTYANAELLGKLHMKNSQFVIRNYSRVSRKLLKSLPILILINIIIHLELIGILFLNSK